MGRIRSYRDVVFSHGKGRAKGEECAVTCVRTGYQMRLGAWSKTTVRRNVG